MSKLRILKSVAEAIEFRNELQFANQNLSLGFVPTMGALHDGHKSLIQKSVAENRFTVVSIYVNQTQFNDPKDFEKYPQTWEQDLKLIEEAGASAVFAPKFEHMYPDHYRFKVTESDFSKVLEGEARPGHFDGVLSVVMKLLNIIRPNKAYFGEKDFQQLKLIEDMTKAYFLNVEIVACPTKREPSGLAMSSRNVRLSMAGKEKASLIYKAISNEKSPEAAKQILLQNGFEVDYVEDFKGRRFAAAFLEGVRLIDNIEIKL